MQWYHYTLLALAIFAGVCSWRVPHALCWLAAVCGSFIVSVLWHRAGLPGGVVFGAACNFAICVMLSLRRAPAPWEMGVFNGVILMILIDWLYAAGYIVSHEIFSIALELVNAAVLLIIAAPGAYQWVDQHGFFHHRDRGAADRCHQALFAAKQRPAHWGKKQ